MGFRLDRETSLNTNKILVQYALVILVQKPNCISKFGKVTKKPSLKKSKGFSRDTHNGSVLELFYQDLLQFYELKETLRTEGISNYRETHLDNKGNGRNSLLQIRKETWRRKKKETPNQITGTVKTDSNFFN